MASESKTAEFARLFDLFERLASRKSRTRTDENHEDVRSILLPADLAPVITSLASLVGTRKYQGDAQHKKQTSKRARRNTVATSSRNAHDLDSDDDDDEQSLATFPLGKKYPFTFKLMLHKLYQLDDWAQKVKEVLERSQIEYKPLAERAAEVKVEEEEEVKRQDGRVHFKAGTAAAGPRRPTVRPRSHSVMALSKGRDTGSLSPSSKSPAQWGPAEEDIRAVKKRCVGRRKSLSGPLGEVGRIGGGWVYDAAVSSAEFTGRDLHTARFKAPGGHVQTSKYPSLGAGPNKVAGRRRVSLGTTSAVGQQQNRENGIATRKRALSVMNNLTLVQAQRKRPFEL